MNRERFTGRTEGRPRAIGTGLRIFGGNTPFYQHLRHGVVQYITTQKSASMPCRPEGGMYRPLMSYMRLWLSVVQVHI
jgi:hypothetical protein